MTKITNPVGSNNATIQNKTINNSKQSVFDKLKIALEKIKKAEKVSDSSGELTGYVLYTHRLKVDDFERIFKNNKAFYSEVLLSANTTNSKQTGTILEMYVNIPQLTDMLPDPNLNVLFSLMDNKEKVSEANAKSQSSKTAAAAGGDTSSDVFYPDGSLQPMPFRGRGDTSGFWPSTEAAEAFKKSDKGDPSNAGKPEPIEVINLETKKVFDLITMYPRVYKYTESNEYYGLGSAVLVNFPMMQKKHLPTMGYGIFKRLLRGTADTSAANPIEKHIQEVVKASEKDST